jgi:hypothetical protein
VSIRKPNKRVKKHGENQQEYARQQPVIDSTFYQKDSEATQTTCDNS